MNAKANKPTQLRSIAFLGCAVCMLSAQVAVCLPSVGVELISPSNGAVEQSAYTARLTWFYDWQGYGDRMEFKVFLGKEPANLAVKETREGNNIAQAMHFDPGTLEPSRYYYWKVEGKYISDPSSLSVSPIWRFKTASVNPPAAVGNPTPPNQAREVALDAELRWNAARGATGYDIYLSEGDSIAQQDLISSQATIGYAPGSLKADAKYLWRVDARNAQGVTSGPLWHFYTVISRIHLTTPPDNTAVWSRGTTHTILWESVGENGSHLRLSLLESGKYKTILNPGIVNDGSYDWTVPAALVVKPGAIYQLELLSAKSGAFSFSAPFAIQSTTTAAQAEWLRLK